MKVGYIKELIALGEYVLEWAHCALVHVHS